MRPDRDAGAGAGTTAPVRRISIIAPMLNESAYIEPFVSDIAMQDYEGVVEVIVADGGSSDGSVQQLIAAAEQRALDLTVIENNHGWVSHSLNECVRRARGDLVVRLDCHSRYPSDYLRRCAAAAEETDALVVGGVIVAQGQTAVQRAVAAAMDTPFGGIGFYRVFSSDASVLRRLGAALGLRAAYAGNEATRVESDTATFGAFRPEAFARAGLFDESLRRNQDDEFNLRVRRAGGRVILDSSIRVFYAPRSSLPGVFRQYYEYGLWKVPVILKHRQAPSPRSLAPVAFVASLAALAPAAVVSTSARRLLSAQLAAYTALAIGFGVTTVRRRREPWRLVPVTIAVFPAFHAGYGLGMLRGWASRLRRR
jgi:succinoglycan biosynthesis protein ExoA